MCEIRGIRRIVVFTARSVQRAHARTRSASHVDGDSGRRAIVFPRTYYPSDISRNDGRQLMARFFF